MIKNHWLFIEKNSIYSQWFFFIINNKIKIRNKIERGNLHEKNKRVLQNYLTGFFIDLILFTIVGVSATAVFPSNQTTYNNGTTGMKATNVQTAIDELYSTCFK